LWGAGIGKSFAHDLGMLRLVHKLPMEKPNLSLSFSLMDTFSSSRFLFLQTTKSDTSKQSSSNGHQKKKQDKKDKSVSKTEGAAKPDGTGSSDPDDVKETPC
jgi:hypothetical protein